MTDYRLCGIVVLAVITGVFYAVLMVLTLRHLVMGINRNKDYKPKKKWKSGKNSSIV